MTNNYNIQESERVPVIPSWQGWEGIKFIQNLHDEEQEKCKTSAGLTEVLSNKFKPQHNRNNIIIAILQAHNRAK